jgi:rsbT antagonist protein RsbS
MSSSSIPILSLYGRLLVSLQGEISDRQMDDLTRAVLEKIRDSSARGLVLDASGVWAMDSHLCAVLGRLAEAARLMGATPVLCGLSPSVVMTLQTMGIELNDVETALGVEESLERLGLVVVEGPRPDDEDGEDARITPAEAAAP